MSLRNAAVALVMVVLTACGESTPPKSAGQSAPIRMACTTPEQAGLKAQDITRKLVEAKKQDAISQDEYVAYNNTLGEGLRAWSERGDLVAYCRTLERIVKDAGLK